MEAHLCYSLEKKKKKKSIYKKVIATFYIYFFAIVSLHLTILTFIS